MTRAPGPDASSSQDVRVLPSDSEERLTAFANMAITWAGNEAVSEAWRAWTVTMPSDAVVQAGAWGTPEEIASRCPIRMPSDVAAVAIVPVTDAAGNPLENVLPGIGAVLCVASAIPHRWTDRELAAVRAVATAAGVEIQLRGDAARHAVAVEKLRTSPLHDPVTELANRELFLDRVGQALMRCAREPRRHLAVLSVAIDQFRDIESTFGYAVAEQVLKEVASRLRVAVRTVDSVARLAGAEFGILIESLRDDSDAARVAQRIHDVLRAPIRTTWDEFVVTASIGVMRSAVGVDSAARLIQLAVLARERAVNSASDYELFDPDMHRRAQQRLQLEMELRRGLEAQEFELHYQPIVSVADGRAVELEALMRWRHPKRGLVPAAEFIALAESTGLVVPMGWFVLTQACHQIREWRSRNEKAAQLPVSINFTAAHLAQDDLANKLRDALQVAELPDHSLNIEVTEGLFIGDPERAKRAIDDVRDLGVGVHIDDFGTGYSSLQYLHELQLDAIKIDRRFIADGTLGVGKVHVAATIRDLARAMAVPVIAEGVETMEQLQRVKELGCEFAQGYLFSPAVPPHEVSDVVRKGWSM